MPDIFLRPGDENPDNIDLRDPTQQDLVPVYFTASAAARFTTSAVLDVLEPFVAVANLVTTTHAVLTYIAPQVIPSYGTGAGWPDIFGNAKEAKVHKVTLRIRKRERGVVERVLDFLSLPLSKVFPSASMRVRIPLAAAGGIRSSAKATMRNHVRFEGRAGMATTAHADTMYVHVSREKFEKDLMEILMIDAA
jgi:hypothetical protein